MLMRVLKWLALGGFIMGNNIASAGQANDENPPSLELLEYLGMLVETENGLVGPESLGEASSITDEQDQSGLKEVLPDRTDTNTAREDFDHDQ